MFLRRFPQHISIASLAISLLLFLSVVFELRRKVDLDDMRNAELHTPTLKLDNPTKTSLAPTHSLVGPSQVQTKPPTAQPASSPTTVTLFVNNHKTTANSRTATPHVSVRDPSGVLTQQINQTTSRPPTSGHNLQSKLLIELLSRKVPECTTDGKRGEAFLNTLFHDSYRHFTSCLTCHSRTSHSEPFLEMNLPICGNIGRDDVFPDTDSLSDLFYTITAPERLVGDNLYA
ncbi:hypothetical protein BLNAU_21288 [Blattamonas nauphoetae]|uniref:Cytochrome c domain-containing protein n=1 Tax=Blattamonas nauphoetae TaxID=2049346 RepID=A0ABQ9WWU4_9EUKA|nr:hypothetical protein BLNAU_21288 [Blattamonas nauphoetae]